MRLVSSNDPRARMIAEQTVAIMDGQLEHKLNAKAKAGLTEALTRIATKDGLQFGSEPFREQPQRWTLDGMLVRLTLRWKRWRHKLDDDGVADEAEAMSATHFRVKRSGAIGLLVILAIALFIGLIKFGEPLELGLQMGRDALRRTAASGDIVIVKKDEESATLFGGLPWARRYDAQLVDKLRTMGAKRIVYNVAMASPSNPVDDEALAAAFDRSKGLVWLGAQKGEVGTASLLPIPLFREKTQQAHFNVHYGMFGQIEYIPEDIKIGGKHYPSQADALAGNTVMPRTLKPDYAIHYKSIRTISATDLMFGRVAESEIAGKAILVVAMSEIKTDAASIFGQGISAFGYIWVIAAETIKNGVANQSGFLIPLLFFAAFGFWCVISQPQRKRYAILAGGGAGLIALTLIGDRFGLHFETIPALLALIVFAMREHMRRAVADALMTHPLSGLPSLEHLSLIKGHEKCAIVTIKLERFEQRIQTLLIAEQRPLYRAIAARINIIAPGHQVHQGDNGVFAFLIPPDSVCDPDVIVRQLRALFVHDIVTGPYRIGYDVGASFGIMRETHLPFDQRLAVALDRAEMTVFTTLHRVV
jgi:diguanylate cyclase